MKKGIWAGASIAALMIAAAPQTASAQDESRSAVDALRDVILVTGTKKADAENVQDVPLAVTAYGDEQLDALKVRDLQSLTYSIPNVSFDDIGTISGYANFSIRGVGINSSIPSIDPTVGVFVDGMYLGVNAGVIMDVFDLESIEVLRGPQGILFGRNVTGGAVLINTKRPSDEPGVSFKGAVESGLRSTGLNYYAMATVGGPITDTIKFKTAAYYNRDEGWHRRYLGGPVPNAVAGVALGPAAALVAGPGTDDFADHGKAETWMVRPAIYWTPSDSFDLTLRYEHGESDGDGPSAQNHPNGVGAPNPFFSAPRDSFDFSLDEPGFVETKWDQFIAEFNLDIGENGTITNIFGWRDYESDSLSDIDATPLFLFHAGATIDQDQISNEFRYAGRWWDTVDITAGVYYFSQDIAYNEIRNIVAGTTFFNGGGVQDQSTVGVFGQLDIDLSDVLTVNLGARYTDEDKDVVISNLLLNPVPCDVRISGSCSEDFVDGDSWSNFTPKVGLEYAARDDLNIYAHWTQGVRSGGYNFRNTAGGSIPGPLFDPSLLPGPFDEEKVNAYEIGFKAQPAGMATVNAAVYLNDISDMQREINLADPLAGVVQIIKNTADATIWGFEIESQIAFTDNFIFQGFVGYTNGEYDSLLFDIGAPAVSPGVVDSADLELEIPRLAPWTYGAGFVYSADLGGMGAADVRFQYNHRDSSFYTDNNLGFLNEVDSIDTSLAWHFTDSATLSIYGKNLLNEVQFGGDTQLPGTLGGGTFSPLTKGRVVGLEIQVSTN